MASKHSSKVYRVTDLPIHVDRLEAARLLAGCIPGLQLEDIQIGSLALSINGQRKKTATVMFKSTPPFVEKEPRQDKWVFPVSGLPGPVVLDTHFNGLTPLNEVHERDHISDCIAISGLGSHPMGSWQPRGEKAFMWIRDELPDLVTDIIKGGVLFGVPSAGMAVEDIYEMLKGQPNEVLLNCLSDRSEYVLSLEEHFKRVSFSYCMRLVWAYETQETPSISKSGESWSRSGPGSVLVSRSSATGGRIASDLCSLNPINSTNDSILQIDSDHSNMVKFTRGDQLIKVLAEKMKQILHSDIQIGIGTKLSMRPVTSDQSPDSTSAFRERCKELLSDLFKTTTPPRNTGGDSGFAHGVSDFLVSSTKIAQMGTQIRHLIQNAAQLQLWIEDIQDLQWLFGEIQSSLKVQSTVFISALGSCTSSCSDILAMLESISISTRDFFVRPPTRESLKQIFASGHPKEGSIYECFGKLSKSKSILIIALELLLVDLTPENIQRLKDAVDLAPEECQCLGALRATNPTHDRDAIIAEKGEIVKGTCRWILSTRQFQTWLETSDPPATLWISAPPGMGKTYLSIFLSRRLQRLCEVRKDCIALFFFCDNKVEMRNTGSGILRGLIYQLIQHRKDLIKVPLQYWRIQDNIFSWINSFQSLWGILQDMLDLLTGTTVYCLIDALDECEKDSALLLLNRFNSLARTNPVVKFIAVSRRYPDHISEALSSGICIELDNNMAAKGDIKSYIKERVCHLATIKQFTNQPLQHYIESVFLQKAQDTFLWVSFMTYDLLQKTVVQIEAALDELPTGLDAVYDRILSQVDSEKTDVISKLLGWVTLAARPLLVSEICEALLIQSTPHLSRERVCLHYISACGHLLQVTQVEAHDLRAIWGDNNDSEDDNDDCSNDAENSIDSSLDSPEPYDQGRGQGKAPSNYEQRVTLVHQSVKDYLLGNGRGTRGNFHIHDPRSMHEEIATRLMHVMAGGSLEHPQHYSKWGLPRALRWPLALYAIFHWQYHFTQVANFEVFAQLHQSFFGERSSLRQKWCQCRYKYLTRGEIHDPIPLLHTACELNLEAPARRLLQLRKEQLGEADFSLSVDRCWGTDTPLHRACFNGNLDMVKLLLEYGADSVHPVNGAGRRPVDEYCRYLDDPSVFAQMVNSKCGQRLLADKGGRLLSLAALDGKTKMCRLLIESHGVHVDARDVYGRTGLEAAIDMHHMELANIFVDEWHASTGDHWRLLGTIMRCRLGIHGALSALLNAIHAWNMNINATDPVSGEGLMHQPFVTWIYPEDVVMLLGHGLDPSIQDRRGRTVLHFMAAGKIVYDVDLLLSLLPDERLKVNTVNIQGETVLHTCVSSILGAETRIIANFGHGACQKVKDLLDLGADRNIKDNEGRLPSDMVYEALHEGWEDCSCSDSTGSVNESYPQGNSHVFTPQLWKVYVGLAENILGILHTYTTVPRFS